MRPARQGVALYVDIYLVGNAAVWIDDVNVSFATEPGVEGVSLPSGNYSVQLNAERGTGVLRTEGQEPLMLLAMAKESVAARKHDQLVFHRCGTSLFLTEVWTAGNGARRTLATSAREKELARKIRPGPEDLGGSPQPVKSCAAAVSVRALAHSLQ